MLYYVEKASRLTFLAELRSTKQVADIQQAASDAEASGELLRSGQQLIVWLHPAFQAINHCAKRVMVPIFICLCLKRSNCLCLGCSITLFKPVLT